MPDQAKIQCDPEPRAGWNMCERAQARRSTVSGRSQQPGAIPRLDAPTTGEVIARVPQHMSSSRQTAAPHARGHAQHVWECIAGHMVGPKASRKSTSAGQIGSPAMRGWSPIVVWLLPTGFRGGKSRKVRDFLAHATPVAVGILLDFISTLRIVDDAAPCSTNSLA